MFNNYVWRLYLESSEGIKALNYFKNLNDSIRENNNLLYIPDFLQKYDPEPPPFNDYDNYSMNIALSTYVKEKILNWKIKDINDAIKKFEVFITEDFKYEDRTICEKFEKDTWSEYNGWLNNIEHLSIGLYRAFPDYFFPYLFFYNFYILTEIFLEFNIPLPKLPRKGNLIENVLYYAKLCQVIYEYRQINNLSSEEMCAFIYSFAPNFIKEDTNKDLPEPSKVWINCVKDKGNIKELNKVVEDSNTNNYQWSGNKNMRKGDIVIMYFSYPHCKIHSIWRAETDGYTDPFFYFMDEVYLCFPIKVLPVTYKDMVGNEILSQNGSIRNNMYGINGKSLKVKEYNAILDILKVKGQDISILPKISVIERIKDIELLTEKDIEINLVEPLLKRLNYSEKDWVRQMPVKMGRGVRYYPDYAIGANVKRGEENSKFIIETKYSISSKKDLTEAYYQAKSYAVRLQAHVFMIASKEGVWIFDSSNNGTFSNKKFFYKNWNEIDNPDEFHQLLLKIGKKIIFNKK